jgi:hypothetical protein
MLRAADNDQVRGESVVVEEERLQLLVQGGETSAPVLNDQRKPAGQVVVRGGGTSKASLPRIEMMPT